MLSKLTKTTGKKEEPPKLSDEELSSIAGKLGLSQEFQHCKAMKGGFGTVFVRYDSLLNRKVAVKLLRKHGDEESFQRECQAVKRLGDIKHDNLMTIYGCAENDDYFFYSMECADNASQAPDADASQDDADYVADSLFLRIARMKGQTPPDDDVFALAKALLAGLACLHSKGLVHLDIKPENILFFNGKPKIADYSLLTATEVQHGQGGGTSGFKPRNPRYMPDGTIDGIDQDLYALGKLLYCYATLKPEDSFPDFSRPADAQRQQHENLFRNNLINVITKAGNSVADERFKNDDEFMAALESCVPAPAKHSGMGTPVAWTAAAIALLSMLSFYILQSKKDDGQTPHISEPPPEILPITSTTRPMPFKDIPNNEWVESQTFFLGIDFDNVVPDKTRRPSGLSVFCIADRNQKAGTPTKLTPGRIMLSPAPDFSFTATSKCTTLHLKREKPMLLLVPIEVKGEFVFAFLCNGSIPCDVSVLVQNGNFNDEAKSIRPQEILQSQIADDAFFGDCRVTAIQEGEHCELSLWINGRKTDSKIAKLNSKRNYLSLVFSSDKEGDVAVSFFKFWEKNTDKNVHFIRENENLSILDGERQFKLAINKQNPSVKQGRFAAELNN